MTLIIDHRPDPDLPPISTTPLPRVRRAAVAGSLLVGVFVVGLGVWSAYAPLASAALAPGVVEPESKRKTVQHFEGGIVSAIMVHDGEAVTPGQTLVRLEDTRARTTLSALQGQLWDALAREARLLAEQAGDASIIVPEALGVRRDDPVTGPVVARILEGQWRIFQTRRSLLESKTTQYRQRIEQTHAEIRGLNAEQVSIDRRIELAKEEIAAVQPLVDKGLERRTRILGLERLKAELEGQRGEAIAGVARSQRVIAEAETAILDVQNDHLNGVAEQLRETQQQIHDLTERIQAATDTLTRTEVKAPEAGVVTDLRIHTPGGVIGAGEPLLDLVPEEDRLTVRVQLRPEDVDAVHVGLPAEVRLLPARGHPTDPVGGTVSYVSADRLTDKVTGQGYYSGYIRLQEEDLGKLDGLVPLPGMPAEVMIRTGETTVALYALTPVLDSFRRAFRER
ncbi:HlyD family type I secretion periplasmic adaptor subunit [Azospirillum soli]|uniref:HlyD family type I secretion periplasmic adaptor subunit n=1 Tax=Azospirillum soli TaxID=1304799 RepID=UPI001AE83B1E|nr:HlyD family type I secretion periplasmic adaptor subunit [Azospirillum soli]MBP2312858.1 HlyD family secretion protein [Azospirillum soli]